MKSNLDSYLYQKLGIAQDQPTYVIGDVQEYETAEQQFEKAQSVASVVHLQGWQHIKSEIIGEYVHRVQGELDSSKESGDLLAARALKVRFAKEFANFVISETEACASVPKPIFKKQEEE
jgi:hypothetical protein